MLGIGAAGRLLLPVVFRKAPANGSLRLLATFCLGTYAWVTVLFLACCVGGYTRPVIWTLWFLSVAAAAWTMLARRAEFARPRMPRWSTILGTVLILAILVTHFVMSVSPALSWDANTYHLTIPKLYLEAGGFRDIPFSIYAKLPLNVELLFGYAMALHNYVLAKSLQLAAILGIVCAAWSCVRDESPWAIWIALVLFFSDAWVAMQANRAYVDLFTTLFFFAGFAFAREARNTDREHPWLLMAGLCAGLLAGSKANGILGSCCLGLYIIWPSIVKSWSSRSMSAVLAGMRTTFTYFGLPVLVMWIAWLARNYAQTGNPVFPLLYSVLGGPDDWSPTVHRQFMDWVLGIGMGRDVSDFLLLPYRLIFPGEGNPFDGGLGIWWSILLPLSLVVAYRTPLVRASLGVGALYFCCWTIGSQQWRLCLPALPLLSVAAALSLHQVVKSWLPRKWVAPVMVVIFLLGARQVQVLMTLPVVYAFRSWRDIPTWSGDDPERAATPPAYAYVNEHADPSARVLLLHTNQAFFLERRFIADSAFAGSQIADWLRQAGNAAEVRRLLAERGVQWVIEASTPVVRFPDALSRMLADPNLATREFEGPGHRVYHLR